MFHAGRLEGCREQLDWILPASCITSIMIRGIERRKVFQRAGGSDQTVHDFCSVHLNFSSQKTKLLFNIIISNTFFQYRSQRNFEISWLEFIQLA